MKYITTPEKFLAALEAAAHPGQANHLAMYATWLGGIVKRGPWMVIPMDDHMVHRGDGVFDAFECLDGHVYQLEAHLTRFDRAIKALGLKPPAEYGRLREIIIETVRAGGQKDCLIRTFVTRGPGDFSQAPSRSVGGQLAVVVTSAHIPKPEFISHGVRAVCTDVPAKPAWMSRYKSTNYLQNVLVKAQAEAAGADYGLCFDAEGNLAEGSVENVGMVNRAGELLFPKRDKIFSGATMTRVLELAEQLIGTGEIKGARGEDIPRASLYEAAELMLCSTSNFVLGITVLDGRPIGDGRPGPVTRRLREMMLRDAAENAALRTRVI